MFRPTAALVGLTFAAAGIAGCGSSDKTSSTPATAAATGATTTAAADKPVNVAFFSPVAANAVAASAWAGAQQEAKKLGAKVTMFDAGFDQNKQISQMQDAIVSGKYQAFVVMPVNGAVLVDPTKAASDKGIKVVADWNNIGPDLSSTKPQVPGVTSVVASDLGADGVTMGNAIVRACEGIDPCTAVFMPGSFKQATETLRMDKVKGVLASHPNIKLKMSAEGGYLADPAMKAATDVLQADPDINVIATPADQMAVGVIQAIKNAGKLGQIKVIGGGTTQTGVKLVRDGTIFSDTVLVPKTQAAKATELAIQAARGETVPASVDAATLSPMGGEITKEKLATGAGKTFTGEYDG
jgi:ribose transport system substrate-binding protein